MPTPKVRHTPARKDKRPNGASTARHPDPRAQKGRVQAPGRAPREPHRALGDNRRPLTLAPPGPAPSSPPEARRIRPRLFLPCAPPLHEEPRPQAPPGGRAPPTRRRRRGLGAGRAGRRARDRSLPRARPAALEVRESERWPAPSLALPGALGVPSALGDPAAPGRTCCPTACPRRASGAAGGCWREPRPGSARGPLRPRFWCRCARCAGSRRCSTRCGPAAWSGGTRVKSGTPAGNSGPSRRPPSPGHHGEWPGRLARRALRL